MSAAQIRRLQTVADPEDPAEALRLVQRHVAEGEHDFALLLERYEQGTMLVARLRTSIDACTAEGEVRRVESLHTGVWLEREAVPCVERQVAEIAPAEYGALARRLCEAGIEAKRSDLSGMYLHVELGEELLDRLLERG